VADHLQHVLTIVLTGLQGGDRWLEPRRSRRLCLCRKGFGSAFEIGDGGAHVLDGPETPLSCALRPLLPDCASSANLAAKVAAARDAGARRVDFYHYALGPLDRLDWIAAALGEG
jgi:hypothetical protein